MSRFFFPVAGAGRKGGVLGSIDRGFLRIFICEEIMFDAFYLFLNPWTTVSGALRHIFKVFVPKRDLTNLFFFFFFSQQRAG